MYLTSCSPIKVRVLQSPAAWKPYLSGSSVSNYLGKAFGRLFLPSYWHFKTFPRTSSSVLKKVPCGRGEIVLSKSRNSMGRLPARFCLVILKFSFEGVVSHFRGYKSRNSCIPRRPMGFYFQFPAGCSALAFLACLSISSLDVLSPHLLSNSVFAISTALLVLSLRCCKQNKRADVWRRKSRVQIIPLPSSYLCRG